VAGGAQVSDQDVVVAGKVVTANGPPAAAEFAKALAKVLAGQSGGPGG
jgi:putative intracellular protease/amidase